MFARKLRFFAEVPKRSWADFSTGFALRDQKKTQDESERMKKFHAKLNSETPEDLLLIEIDPKSGEYLPEAEKNPTKWGDWQIGGRVSDF